MIGENHTSGAHGEARDAHPVHPPGSYVEIKSVGDGANTKLSVRCTLQEDGTVGMVGEAEFVENLKKGFEAPFYGAPRFVTPEDGVLFLLGLEAQFKSGYVMVSEILPPQIKS